MMSLTMRLRFAALTAAMVVSSSNVCSEVVAAKPFMSTITSCVLNHKVASIVAIALIAAKIRLNTKPRTKYSAADWDADVKELLNSYNIFDAQSRAVILAFIDKYFVGTEFKREETTTRSKNEDGSVFTIKGCKVTQTPFGLMGLVDAYVLQQMKKTTELIPVAAGFYLLANDPCAAWAREAKKLA